MSDPSNHTRSDAIIRVLKGLLRPLVRALIAQGVTAPAFYRLVKQAYVDVAEKELGVGTAAVTDSQISVATGVHRRDVKAMRSKDQTEEAATRAKISTLSLVVGNWLALDDYTSQDGTPKALPRFGSGTPSFESLVQSISRDIRPRTVLDELIRQNLVDLDAEKEMVTLQTHAFVGPADQEQRIHFFSSNVGDHLAAAAENLVAENPPFLERAVYYNRLSQDSVDILEEMARDLGNQTLLKVNKIANEQQANDKNLETPLERFRFGMFFYREEEKSAPNPDDENPDE